MHLWSRARAPVSARTQRADAAGDGSRRFQGSTRLPRIEAPNQNRLTRGPRGRRDRSFRKGTRPLGVRRAQDPCPVQGRGSRVVRSALYPTANPRFPTDLPGSTRLAPRSRRPLDPTVSTARPCTDRAVAHNRWGPWVGFGGRALGPATGKNARAAGPSAGSPPPPHPPFPFDRDLARSRGFDLSDRALGGAVHGPGRRVSLLCPASAC